MLVSSKQKQTVGWEFRQGDDDKGYQLANSVTSCLQCLNLLMFDNYGSNKSRPGGADNERKKTVRRQGEWRNENKENENKNKGRGILPERKHTWNLMFCSMKKNNLSSSWKDISFLRKQNHGDHNLYRLPREPQSLPLNTGTTILTTYHGDYNPYCLPRGPQSLPLTTGTTIITAYQGDHKPYCLSRGPQSLQLKSSL